MDPTLFFVLLVVIVLIFVLAVPALLYAGLKRIANPVPLRLPLLVSGLVVLVLAGILQAGIFGGGDTLAVTLVLATLMLLVMVLAVISPFPYFEKKIRVDPPWAVFPLISFVGAYLLFLTTMGESKEGGPLNEFSLLLPFTGWILDGAASLLHLGDVVYSSALQVHTILLIIGYYLEVFIFAGLFYLVMSVVPKAKNEEPK